MTSKRKETGTRGARKLKLKKETVKDLEARGKTGKVKGGAVTLSCQVGGICGPTLGCATAAYTNCNVSCVAVCGGGVFKP